MGLTGASIHAGRTPRTASRAAADSKDRSPTLEWVVNPIRSEDPELGRAFEQAVADSLRGEDLERVQVRFGIWRAEPWRPQFVCKLECGGGIAEGAWRWWSPIVGTPEELGAAVREALDARRRRRALRAAH